jgi:MFS family permease
MPLMFSAVALSILVGRLISRTGRYKGFVLAGLIVMGVGYYLLIRLGYGSTQADLTVAMVIVGLGLGVVMQTYILIVQNATPREDLGIATSVTQLTRSIGATLGPAIFGTVMVSRMKIEIPKHLHSEALNGSQVERFSRESGVGSLLNPNALGQLPPTIATGIREGLAAAMHSVFLVGLAIILIALAASIFIKELPLRETAFTDEDAGKQILDEPNRSAANGAYAPDRRDERQKP